MKAVRVSAGLLALVGALTLGVRRMSAEPDGAGSAPDRPVVGAIRWDAWTGGEVTAQVERTLGPKRYHHRLPWFAEVLSENRVRIDGGRQAVMDREIAFAADAGLDYWAFLVYPKTSPMSVALGQYLKSPRRDRVRFCLILHSTLKAGPAAWPAERDRIITLLREPGYQTVLAGRPLVYAFIGGGFPFERFGELRKAAERAGLKPYWVYMGWDPVRDFAQVSGKGFDAVSAYAMGGSQPTFEQLATAVERRYWHRAAAAKVPLVPMITTGWDKRPRKDHPVSWEKGHAYHTQKTFPSMATPGQIAAHLRRGIQFIHRNPAVCPTRALILYAWNEYDEGGWIAPTRGADGKPDTRRLDAIANVLRETPAPHPKEDAPVTEREIADVLAGRFRWRMSAPLVAPVKRPADPCHAIKDPSVVFHDGRWHLFCTIRSKKRTHAVEYLSFADWKDADAAQRHVLTASDGFFCAPQVFFFAPQKKWYMICQASDESWDPKYGASYATSTDLADPKSWTKVQPLGAKRVGGKKAGLDFWIICDEKKAHLFFTTLDGRMWREETPLAEFPRGWSEPKLAIRGDIFEASHIYALKGTGKYIAVIEAQGGRGWRYFKAYLADRLEGPWKPIAATKQKTFASMANVRHPKPRWTDCISHGELLRAGIDQRLEVDPANLRLLFQGVLDKDRSGKNYGQIPWRLGLLESERESE